MNTDATVRNEAELLTCPKRTNRAELKIMRMSLPHHRWLHFVLGSLGVGQSGDLNYSWLKRGTLPKVGQRGK